MFAPGSRAHCGIDGSIGDRGTCGGGAIGVKVDIPGDAMLGNGQCGLGVACAELREGMSLCCVGAGGCAIDSVRDAPPAAYTLGDSTLMSSAIEARSALSKNKSFASSKLGFPPSETLGASAKLGLGIRRRRLLVTSIGCDGVLPAVQTERRSTQLCVPVAWAAGARL